MAITRYYFSRQNAPIIPINWIDAGFWDATGQDSTRRLLSTIKTHATQGYLDIEPNCLGSSTEEFILFGRWVSSGLSGPQTLAGTVKGVIRGRENNVSVGATIVLGVQVISSVGVHRGTLLSHTYSTGQSVPPEFSSVAAPGNTRMFRDISNNTTINLSSVDIENGDSLVIEIGYRELDTQTLNEAGINMGVVSGNDDAAFDDLEGGPPYPNPWIEFNFTESTSNVRRNDLPFWSLLIPQFQ